MFGTIRRHQTWLWVIIGSLTILSFVVFGPTTSSKMGDPLRRQSASAGMLAGQPIPVDLFYQAQKEVMLGYYLMHGSFPTAQSERENGFNVTRETYIRLLENHKEEELGIRVSMEAVASSARELLGAATLEDLDKKVLQPGNLTRDDFERFLRHRLALDQLVMMTGLSGKLVTPQEAEDIYKKEHESVSTTAVLFPAAEYLDKVTVTPAQLTNYYNQAQARYAIPVRRQVDYVKWEATNYLAQVHARLTNLDALAEQNYKSGTNLFGGAKTPEEAKEKFKEMALRRQAVLEARKVAGQFADELYTKPHALSSLGELAAAKGYKVGFTQPFDREDGPREIDVLPVFVQRAFALTKDEPFSGAVECDDGVYVIALRKELPSEIPPLKDVEAKVTADYKLLQAEQMARAEGTAFSAAVTNGLASGKNFNEIAIGLKRQPVPVSPFSLSARELPPELTLKTSLQMLRQVAFSIDPGHVSPFIPTEDGGYVLFIDGKVAVDSERMKRELPEFLAYLRQARQTDAVNQWFMKQMEADKGFSDTVQAAMERNSGQGKTRPPTRKS